MPLLLIRNDLWKGSGRRRRRNVLAVVPQAPCKKSGSVEMEPFIFTGLFFVIK